MNPEAFSEWLDAAVNQMMIEAMKAAATLLWFIEKVAAGIARFLSDQDMWSLILDSSMDAIRGFMPGVLGQLVLGHNGMFYLALMLAGIFLILPNLGTTRLVEAPRAVLWGVILISLFISGQFGYDLLGYAENIRSYSAQTVINAASGGASSSLDSLVAVPMRASPPDMQDYAFKLPTAFEEEYFPEATDYEEIPVFEFTGIINWSLTITVETPESQQQRREQAQVGLALAALTLVAGYVLALFAFVFATLTAAALTLIIFFVVALPLGFFEFGMGILNGIIRQYAYLFAVTLLAVGLAGILAAAQWTVFTGPPPSPAELLAFVPILLIVSVAMGYVARMAGSTLAATFGMVTTSIQRSMTPLAYAGALPRAGGIPGAGAVQGAVGLGGAALAALATGGASAAVMAGAGTALANLSPGTGQAAARPTGSERPIGSVFTAAAGGGETTEVAVPGRAWSDKQGKAATAAFGSAQRAEARRPAEAWGAVDAGAYHTTDLRHLDAAEQSHQAGRKSEARQHLERAFGNREAASTALELYDQGRAGDVRAVVETTQAVARTLSQAGKDVFDDKGHASSAFSEAVTTQLKGQGLVGRDAGVAAAVGQIAGATVRQPVGIWAAPDPARQLAQATLSPQGSQVMAGDLSAQYRLSALAAEHRWDEKRLTALFEATRHGLGATGGAALPGTVAQISSQLGDKGEWSDATQPVLDEVSRLAALVAENAQAQRGATLEIPAAPPAQAVGASEEALAAAQVASSNPTLKGGK